MVYYSKEEEKNVRRKLEEGKSVSEIIEETGMTRRAVFRIKINNAKEEKAEEVEIENPKVEISFELLEDAMNQLRKFEKFELITKIVDDIMNNDKVDDSTKSSLQRHLASIDIAEGRLEQARKRIKQELDEKVLSENDKNKLTIQLIVIEISDGNYNEAEKLANNLLNKQELSKLDEIKVRTQLVTVSMSREDFSLAAYRAVQILKIEEIPAKTKGIIVSKIAKMNRLQSKYNEAKRITKMLLNGEDVSDIIKYIESIYPEIIEMEKWKSDSEVTSKDATVELQNEDEIDKKRRKIYENEIKMEDINDLAEKNKDTLHGCLFTAETCAYFNLPNLGSNCLKGYRKNNPNMKKSEMKTISKALELLKRDGLNEQRLKEEWGKIYEYLEQSRDEGKEL